MIFHRSRLQLELEVSRVTQKRPVEEDTSGRKKRRINRCLAQDQINPDIDPSWMSYVDNHPHAKSGILLQALRYIAGPEVLLELAGVRARDNPSTPEETNTTQTLVQLFLMSREAQYHAALQMRWCASKLHIDYLDRIATIKGARKAIANERHRTLRQERDGQKDTCTEPQPKVAAKIRAEEEMVNESLRGLHLSDTERPRYEKFYTGLLKQGASISKLLNALGVPTMSPALIPLSPHGGLKLAT